MEEREASGAARVCRRPPPAAVPSHRSPERPPPYLPIVPRRGRRRELRPPSRMPRSQRRRRQRQIPLCLSPCAPVLPPWRSPVTPPRRATMRTAPSLAGSLYFVSSFIFPQIVFFCQTTTSPCFYSPSESRIHPLSELEVDRTSKVEPPARPLAAVLSFLRPPVPSHRRFSPLCRIEVRAVEPRPGRAAPHPTTGWTPCSRRRSPVCPHTAGTCVVVLVAGARVVVPADEDVVPVPCG